MSERNTLIRSLHDIGIAAWFGGGLMGAIGLNGAASVAKDPQERLRLSSVGWARWAPFQVAAIAMHGIGGLGLIYSNKGRVALQSETRVNTGVKVVLTLLACATTLYSGLVGKKIADHADESAAGATEPDSGSSDALASAQRQQKILQWATPAITLVLIVLGAQQGELQRPLAGWLRR